MEHILIIGGGGTGAALAHDLTLRGFTVALFEKGEIFSGATGRHHGLLHSGARYALDDPEAARECIEENMILRKLAPQAIEPNDGLFVALTDDDMQLVDRFLAQCATAAIPTKIWSPAQALALEPALNPALKLAIQVPDATFDAWRLPLHFLATAQSNGAKLHRFTEVIGIHTTAGVVTGIRVRDLRCQREFDVTGDLVVNAAGAWSGRVTALAGVQVPIQPGPGVMVAIKQRVTNMVINRLHPAGEGDIIVPQRKLAVLGTSLWLAQDPDVVRLPSEHIHRMFELCSAMVPGVKNYPVHAAWSASRPLIGKGNLADPQQISRTFECFDHHVKDGVEGLVSIIGGKATTQRAMAEKTANVICQKFGRELPCRTKETPLLPYRRFFS